jgi:hypothetical protein
MTKTNFEKLVRWDADYYKELTDDDCIVCLTEREVYLVGQIIDMIKWSNTRWVGNLLGLDFDAIAGALEYKLSERMTCQNITTLLQKITQLEAKIDYVFNETVVNEGDTPFSPDTTVMDDVFTPEEMQTGDMAVQADICDNDGKSAIYGAVSEVVRYIVGLNTDLLQRFEQSVGNLAEQAETLLSAFPPTDLLAVDEVAKYTAFLTQELQEEYEATVDEELIQTTICDIFCIASANNCTLTMWDIYNYFGSKVDPTFTNAALTYANLVNFAFTGTFAGDMYFHYLCYFQLASAAFNGAVTGDGLEAYERQIAAGFNSPDADWMIHCVECPPLYRLYTVDFSLGMDEFTFLVAPGGSSCPGLTLGTLTSGRITGVHCGAQNAIGVTMPLETDWRIRGIKLHLERRNGQENGGQDYETVTMVRAVGNANFIQGGFRENGIIERCGYMTVAPNYRDGGSALEIRMGVFYDADPLSEIFLDKVEMLFEMNYAPDRAIISYDGNICV